MAEFEDWCTINGDLASNRKRVIRQFTGWARFMHFYAVFNYVLQQVEAAGDVYWAVHPRYGCEI